MERPKTTKNVGQPCVICGQSADAQAAIAALQAQLTQLDRTLADVYAQREGLQRERDVLRRQVDTQRRTIQRYQASHDEHTQLQALARALPVYAADALITVDGDLDEIDRPALRSAVMELLEYRATLDATTPAQTDEQRFIKACCERPDDCKWGGGSGGCGYEGRKPKGGDGE